MSIDKIKIAPQVGSNDAYVVRVGEHKCGIVRRTIAGRWVCEFENTPRIKTTMYSYKTRREAVAALIAKAVA